MAQSRDDLLRQALIEHAKLEQSLLPDGGGAEPATDLVGDSMGDTLKRVGRWLVGQPTDKPMDVAKAGADMGRAFVSGVPMAGRIAGVVAGGAMGAAVGLPNVGAGLGQEAVGQPLDLLAEYMGVKPKETPSERAIGAATNVATTASLGWAFQKAANLMFNGWEWTKEGIKRAAGGGPEAATNAQALETAGVNPKGAIGAITQDKNVQGAQNILRKLPGAAGVMNREIDATRASLAAQTEKAIRTVGTPPEEMEVAGAVAQKAARSFIAGEKERIGGLYSRIPSLKDTAVELQPLFTQAEQLAEQNAKGMGDPATASLLKKVFMRLDGTSRPATVPFGEAQLMRSDLIDYGHAQDAEIAGKAQGTAKALTQTLDDLMERSGQKLAPAELGTWRSANAQWARFRGDVDLIRNVANAPKTVDAFKQVFAGAADGPETLRAIKGTMPQGRFNDLMAFRLVDQGRAPDGTFDPVVLLKNLDKVKSAESKGLLLGASGTQQRETWDKLLTVARLFTTDRVMQNPSGTAGAGAFADVMKGGMGASALVGLTHPIAGAMTLAAEIGGPYGMARLLTSDAYRRWLTSAMQTRPSNYVGLSLHLGRLVGIAKAEPELREAINDLLMGWKMLNLAPGVHQQERKKTPAPAPGRPVAGKG